MNRKVAAIEIGLNATRLLISIVQDKPDGVKLKKEILVRIPLRLGEDCYVKGCISQQRISTLLRTMKAFQYLLHLHQVKAYVAYASAALQEASNYDVIIGLLREKAHTQVQLLSVHEEALFLRGSYSSDKLNKSKNYLYINVGGGTTEIVLLANGQMTDAKRFPIGSIRLLFGLVSIQEKKALTDYLCEIREKFAPCALIGAGGNINKLAQLTGLTRDNIVSRRSLQTIYNKLRQQSPEGRMSHYELSADRADVIVPACYLYILMARTSGVSKIIVPTIGLVDGMVHYLAHTLCQQYTIKTSKPTHDMYENLPFNLQMDTFSTTMQSNFRTSNEADWFFIDDNDFDDDDDDDD